MCRSSRICTQFTTGTCWRWIFTIKGTITAAFAVPPKFLVVDFPNRAKFLKPRERDTIMTIPNTNKKNARLLKSWKNLKDLKNCILWLCTLKYLCNMCLAYGLVYYVPTILVSLSYTGLRDICILIQDKHFGTTPPLASLLV